MSTIVGMSLLAAAGVIVVLILGLLRAAGRVSPVTETVERFLAAPAAPARWLDPLPVLWCFRCGGNRPGTVHRLNDAKWWRCCLCDQQRDISEEELPL